MMRRWEADRRGLGAARGVVLVLTWYVVIAATVYAIGSLLAGHPVAIITGAVAVLGGYLWATRDRPDTTTTDDTTEDPS